MYKINYKVFTGVILIFFTTQMQAIDKNSCEEYYIKYNNTVYDYKLRIEDKTDKYGCDVIQLYNKMIQLEDMEAFMDVLDENPSMIPAVKKIFNHKSIVKLLSQYPVLKMSLFNQSTTTVFVDNFYAVIKKYMNYAMKKKILNQPEYFNYFLIASKTTTNKKEAINHYTLLRKTLTPDRLSLFLAFYNVTKKDMSFRQLLNNIVTLQNYLDDKESRDLLMYPQYIGYLFRDSSSYTDKKFSKIYSKVYQSLAITIFKTMYKHLRYEKDIDQIQFALKTLEKISPYLKQQPLKNREPFGSIVEELINKGFMTQLFDKGLCSDKTTEKFAIFGKNNIYNIVSLKRDYPAIYETLINSNNYKGIYSLSYVANALNTLLPKEREIFVTLLSELPGESIYMKVHFIHRLENMGYLRNIVKIKDYESDISASSDDTRGKSTMKFVYILLTSYPKQNGSSIVDRYYSGQFNEYDVRKYLAKLSKMPKDELEDHCFSSIEKTEKYIGVAENAALAISIIAIPFTGGVSLAYVSSSLARKIGTKSLKYMVKKSIRSINRGIRYTNNTRGGMMRKFGERKMKNVGRKIDEGEEWTDNGSDLFFMGSGLLLLGTTIETKNICEEIK